MVERESARTRRRTVHQPVVVLRIYNLEMKRVVLHSLREAGWRPVDIPGVMDLIPDGCDPVGAIVDVPLDDSRVQWLCGLGFPIVRLGVVPDNKDETYPAVLMDHAVAGRLAADHIIERGYRNVGFIAPPWEHVHVNYDAFDRRLKASGRSCECLALRRMDGGGSPQERQRARYDAIEEWIHDQPKPFAIFTYAGIASMVCMSCASQGLAIPEDVALLAFDNATLATQGDLVDLSAIDLGYDEFSVEAATLLERLVAGELPPKEPILIPPKGVIEGHSTNALAVPDPVVRKALRYIWDNLELQVSIAHVASEVAVSRSTLERKFRQSLGRSVNAERHRKRLSRCAELLLSTDLTIADIGRFAGIPNASYFHRSFRKEYGLTPREYRLRSGT